MSKMCTSILVSVVSLVKILHHLYLKFLSFWCLCIIKGSDLDGVLTSGASHAQQFPLIAVPANIIHAVSSNIRVSSSGRCFQTYTNQSNVPIEANTFSLGRQGSCVWFRHSSMGSTWWEVRRAPTVLWDGASWSP